MESVLRQDYLDIEYIVVDGGSEDDTLSIIKEYESKFRGRMHWLSEPDCGIYDAMNKGLRMASGEVVGIINSDDFYIHDNVISRVAKALEDKDTEAVYGDVRYVRPENLEKTVRYYSCRHWRPWKFRFGFLPAHPTFFTYKSFFESFGYYKTDYQISGDYELLIRFICIHGIKARYLPIDFLKMRTGGRSTNGLRSTLISNHEIVRACGENGIWTCQFLLFFRYFIKIGELLFIKSRES